MRRLRTLALFILLGALTTTLVAWAFAAIGSTPRHVGVLPGDTAPRFMEPGEVLPWPLPVPSDWPSPMVIDERAGRGLRLLMATSATGHTDPSGAPSEKRTHYRVAGAKCGWPMLAMRTTTRSSVTDEHDHTDRTPAISLPRWLHDFADRMTYGYYAQRAFPLTPIWSGFLINTVLYALTFWLILRSLPWIRAIRRKRHRQCITCGYPIGIRSFCTECGTVVAVNDANRTT